MFLGVPFAKPPVKELRFEKPVPPDNWTLKETLEYQSSCLPLIIPERSAKFLYWTEKYDEDCLYLNIFSPHKSENDLNIDTPNLPVLVLIHGGIFLFGSSFGYSNYVDIGQKYVNQGIIVVTLQHRLGVFGFASSGDSNLPGNLGLWDLTAALNAGSALIGALSLSPNSADYFSQAAQFSATILSARGTGAHVVESTLELANSVNCQNSNTLKMKECLKALSTENLLSAIKQQALLTTPEKQFGIPTFGPLVEHDFFQEVDYPDLMRIYAKNSKPTMIGYNNLEALYICEGSAGKSNCRILYWRQVCRRKCYFLFGTIRSVSVRLAVHSAILWEARIKAVNNWPLYLYVITYASSDLPEEVPVKGSFHTKDDDYLFKTHSQTKEFSKSDQKVEDQLVNSLRNFVKYGDPSFGSVKWPLTDAKIFRRMRFDLPSATVEDSTEDFKRVEFWDKLIKLTGYNAVRDIFVNKSNKNEL
uniref:Carboxylesterase type B domain-containing protein n=1 Tax=Ditylenchus dipsaci TaxID=166011 RepID=A0A915EGP1_9BILA